MADSLCGYRKVVSTLAFFSPYYILLVGYHHVPWHLISVSNTRDLFVYDRNSLRSSPAAHEQNLCTVRYRHIQSLVTVPY